MGYTKDTGGYSLLFYRGVSINETIRSSYDIVVTESFIYSKVSDTDIFAFNWIRVKNFIPFFDKGLRYILEKTNKSNMADLYVVGHTTLDDVALLKEVSVSENTNTIFCEYEVFDDWMFSHGLEVMSIGYGKIENVQEYLDKVEIIKDCLSILRKPKPTMTISSGSSRTSMQSHLRAFKMNPSRLKMDSFMRDRHSTLVQIVVDNEPRFSRSEDTDLTRLGYTGFYSDLTPDLYLQEGGGYIILEVAITSTDVMRVLEMKEKKYECMVQDMRMSGIIANMQYLILSDSNSDRYIPRVCEPFRCEIVDFQKSVIRYTTELASVEGYWAIKRETETARELGKNKEEINAIIVAIKNMNSSRKLNKPAEDMGNSFMMGSDPEKRPLVMKEEDQVYNKVKKDVEEFDAYKYYLSLKKNLGKKLEVNDPPISLAPVLSSISALSYKGILLEKERSIRAEYLKSSKIKKSLFKMPNLIGLTTWNTSVNSTQMDLGEIIDVSGDGTMYFSRKVKVQDKENIFVGAGMGCVPADFSEVKRCIEYLSETCSNVFKKFAGKYAEKFSNREDTMVPDIPEDRMYTMMTTKMFEQLYNTHLMAREIILLEQRRIREDSSYTVARDSDLFGLCIKNGSRLTTEKQIRYKLFRNLSDRDYRGFFKEEEGHSTDWLALNHTDLRTMLTMFHKAAVLVSHMYDCYMEKNSLDMSFSEYLMSDMAMGPLIIMLEMRKGTSTTAQYSRYILNSMMGMASNKVKTMSDIFADPTRSVVASYVKQVQLDWAVALDDIRKKTEIEMVSKYLKSDSDYDSFMMPSLFNNSIFVEMSYTMNDIYLGNLFQKDSGFMGHKSKEIIKKMISEEIHYMKIRDLASLNGNLTIQDCYEKADEKHMFNKEFVMLMGSMINKQYLSDPKLLVSLMAKMENSIHTAMMMTKCLYDTSLSTYTLDKNPKAMSYNNELVFLALRNLIEENQTFCLSELISRETVVEAVFSMFPKSQIGGPREILMQSYRLRAHVRLMEGLMESICTVMKKERITDDGSKEYDQSSMVHKLRKESIVLKTKGMYSLTGSLVADASRWAPSFTMANFLYFLLSLKLPESIEDVCVNVVRAFANKILIFPKALNLKWQSKPVNELESDKDMEWARNMTKGNDGAMRIFSGMGQGMLHRYSSVYHCAKDDVMDRLLSDYQKDWNTIVTSHTMISSDDLLKQMRFSSMTPNSISKAIQLTLQVYEVTNRLANIHTNWKKTSFNVIIDEFNSYFTRGKKASLAVVKDIFTAMEVVDLTQPLLAVNDIVDNLSRCFLNGLYYSTLEMAFVLMRDLLIEVYHLESVIPYFKTIFDVEDEQLLPADLGFLSTKYPVAQCLFSNRVCMFFRENSKSIMDFYRCIHTGEDPELSGRTDISNVLSRRILLTLPYWKDQEKNKIIKNYHSKFNIEPKDVLGRLENAMLKVPYYDTFTSVWNFMDGYFLNQERKYESKAIFHLATVIRAMSMTSSRMSASSTDYKDLTIADFVDRVISRDSTKSSIVLYENLKLKMDSYYKAVDKLEFKQVTEKGRHTTRKLINFRTKSTGSQFLNKEALMNMLTNMDSGAKNSYIPIFDDLSNLFNIDKDLLIMGGLHKLLDSVPSKWPMLTLDKVLDQYISLNGRFSVHVMCSFRDAHSSATNIALLMCERLDPSVIYTLTEKSNFDDILDFVSMWLWSGRRWTDLHTKLNMFPDLEAEGDEITSADGKKERVCKYLFIKDYKESFISYYMTEREGALYHIYYSKNEALVTEIKDDMIVLHTWGPIKDNLYVSNKLRLAKKEIEPLTIDQSTIMMNIRNYVCYLEIVTQKCNEWTLFMKTHIELENGQILKTVSKVYIGQTKFSEMWQDVPEFQERANFLSVLVNDELTLYQIQMLMEANSATPKYSVANRATARGRRPTESFGNKDVKEFSSPFVFSNADLFDKMFNYLDAEEEEDKGMFGVNLMDVIEKSWETREEVITKDYFGKRIEAVCCEAITKAIGFEIYRTPNLSSVMPNTDLWHDTFTILKNEFPELNNWMLYLVTYLIMKVHKPSMLKFAPKTLAYKSMPRVFTVVRRHHGRMDEPDLELDEIEEAGVLGFEEVFND
jgi:hypothetical protein